MPRFLESWDICPVPIDLLQLSIRYFFMLLQEKVAAYLSRLPGSTSTSLDASRITDFFNAWYRRIQKLVMFIIDNYSNL